MPTIPPINTAIDLARAELCNQLRNPGDRAHPSPHFNGGATLANIDEKIAWAQRLKTLLDDTIFAMGKTSPAMLYTLPSLSVSRDDQAHGTAYEANNVRIAANHAKAYVDASLKALEAKRTELWDADAEAKAQERLMKSDFAGRGKVEISPFKGLGEFSRPTFRATWHPFFSTPAAAKPPLGPRAGDVVSLNGKGRFKLIEKLRAEVDAKAPVWWIAENLDGDGGFRWTRREPMSIVSIVVDAAGAVKDLDWVGLIDCEMPSTIDFTPSKVIGPKWEVDVDHTNPAGMRRCTANTYDTLAEAKEALVQIARNTYSKLYPRK